MTIATRGHDGALTIIAQTRHVDIDDDACAICGGSGEFEDEEGFFTDCPCRVESERAYWADMDAALDERFGLPAREDAREREREAMPPVMRGLPY